MKPTKQTVYLPVKVEELPQEDGRYGVKINHDDCIDSSYIEEGKWDIEKQSKFVKVKTWLKSQEGYFFTPEQLSQLLSDVIKNTLDTAAEKANMTYCSMWSNDICVDSKSITNTFDETFNKFKI